MRIMEGENLRGCPNDQVGVYNYPLFVVFGRVYKRKGSINLIHYV